MAKKKTDSLPSAGATEQVTVTDVTHQMIEVPVAHDDSAGYYPKFLRSDIKAWTRLQAKKLAAITKALHDSEAQLEDGRVVKKPIHAIKWLVEQVKL